MKINFCSGELYLADNKPIRLEEARGLTILCTAGIIWITVDGEAGDTFLRPSQKHTIAANGLALIESIGDGKIMIAPPRKFTWPRWIAASFDRRGETARPVSLQLSRS
ncbi:DUF2917 domain-containing protein [Dechloromonas sp. TW-R-39-2]|uniref:DUF2917 domain-containing protein n=1 Tax=Dechloromonas sp. TW-R-39-2 TaxID=2654218 RepID=UPI00193DF89C|nr:DUF2917 domain-containing protein [Dechloromonas sp. TW-R-39-2]QRM19853.1 DUF2917 domain-containing protein [Dechloromonas sp. TW-R-39-2]